MISFGPALKATSLAGAGQLGLQQSNGAIAGKAMPQSIRLVRTY
jgi:hypothetical protein